MEKKETREDYQQFPVLPNDHGIRPAGAPDMCFYCRRRVGEPHGPECVVIVRTVTYEVRSAVFGTVALYSKDEPADWNQSLMRFCRNEGSWCIGNIIDDPRLEVLNHDAWAALTRDDDCLCFALSLEPYRVGEEIFRAHD